MRDCILMIADPKIEKGPSESGLCTPFGERQSLSSQDDELRRFERGF